MTKIIYLLSFIMASGAMGQDLTKSRIWEIVSRKRSVFNSTGVFHTPGQIKKSQLKAIRHSYNKRTQVERVVFDFSTAKVPKIYGNVSQKPLKLYLDFFATGISSQINSFGSSHFVSSIDFFPITKKSLSLEMNFKRGVGVDIFYLTNPGRLVIDIKSN